jgi:excisionase family DNA binding protein
MLRANPDARDIRPLFPSGHSRLYSHVGTAKVPGGEAGARMCTRERCSMASSAGSGDSTGPSGEMSELTFLTVAEVAGLMRVSKMTVYRLVHAGELPAVRVGRSFRVPEEAVNEYLRRSFFQTG